MTEKLFYMDSHLKEFDATVISCELYGEGYRAVLDRTAFFPEGGGQAADTGLIDGIRVYDVQEKGDQIFHYLEGALEEGKTAQLTILYNPADTTDAKDVTWSSSDESVATIDQNGLLTAVKAGKTTITAKVGDKEVSYELTVTAKKIDNSNNGNNSGNGNGSNNNNSNVNNKNNNKGNVTANNNGGNKTAKVNKTAKAGTVKTGDTSHVLPVALTLLLSFGVIVLVMMNRKKRVNR